jgi:2-phosphosulfolactate phosphatase
MVDVGPQQVFDRRFEWGLSGARLLAPQVDVLVVVDVLSFATCVDVAVSRDCEVYPAPWADGRAAELADQVGGVLAVARGAMTSENPYSLSPASLTALPRGTRLVLPSPNGATICREAEPWGPTMFVGGLRNALAVAAAAAKHGAIVGVIAAGEQWPDGSLRPALEDLTGAGMILAALGGDPSPEASAAIMTSELATRADLAECASARELIALGYENDVRLAMMCNVSSRAPILRNGAFVDVTSPG